MRGRRALPRGVQGEKLIGQLGDRLADALLGSQPLGATQLAEGRPLPAGIPRDSADLLDRHEDPVVAGEGQLEVVALLARAASAKHLLVASDPVIDVDDEVARREALEQVTRHDPAKGLGSADPHRPEQLPVRDERDAVRAAGEATVEAARHERDRTGWWHVSDPVDHGDAVTGFVEDLGEARCLVRGEDDPGTLRSPGLDRVQEPTGPPEWQRRLAPPEEIAGATRTTRHGNVCRRLRLPCQLEGPRRDESALPVARGEIRRQPVLRKLAGFDELGSSLIRLAPEESGGLGDVARLVKDQDRPWVDVIEPRRRGEVGRPHLGGIADLDRPRRGRGVADRRGPGLLRASRGGDRPKRVIRRASEACQVTGKALREARRRSAETFADRRHARGGEEELRGGQQGRPFDLPGRPLVGRVERPQRVDLVAEELDADRQIHRRREDIDDPAPSRELAAAGDLGDRRVAEMEQVPEQGILVHPSTHP
jgi:hypothetical protein